MSEYKPQIGDMIQRDCGTLAIIEEVSEQGHVIRGQVLHVPEWRCLMIGSIVRIPARAIGETWKVIA